MSPLITIGACCIAFTALFTVWAAMTGSRIGGQSVKDSILEAWTNIAIGFAINYVANLVVLPLAGLPITSSAAFWIGSIFTAISIVRSFLLRRAFNHRMVKRV